MRILSVLPYFSGGAQCDILPLGCTNKQTYLRLVGLIWQVSRLVCGHCGEQRPLQLCSPNVGKGRVFLAPPEEPLSRHPFMMRLALTYWLWRRQFRLALSLINCWMLALFIFYFLSSHQMCVRTDIFNTEITAWIWIEPDPTINTL